MIKSCTLTSFIMSSTSGNTLRGKGMHRLSRRATHELPEISVTEARYPTNSIGNSSHQHFSPTHSTITTVTNYSSSTNNSSSSTTTTTNSSNSNPISLHLISCRDIVSEFSRFPNPHSQNLHDEVLNTLQDDFNVRVGNRNRRRSQTSSTLETQLSKSPHQLSIAKSDVCVYLFTNGTLHDANCFHDLCTAIALKIPVVFVKSTGMDLPKNFAECIRRNSYGCVSFAEYIERYVMDSGSSRETQKQNNQKRKTIRQNNRLAPLSVRSRPTSASELNVKGVDIRKGKRKSSTAEDTDVLLYLVNSFQSAFVFEDNDRMRSSYILKQYLYKTVGNNRDENVRSYDASNDYTIHSLSDSEVKHSTNGAPDTFMHSHDDADKFMNTDSQNRLRVPDPELMISTREWGSSIPSKTMTTYTNSSKTTNNPARDGRFSYDIRMVSPFPVEEKETTYLIFQDKFSPEGIRKINFPVGNDDLKEEIICEESESEDESDPRHSPILIPDIDLGREVNKSIIETPDNEM